MTDAEATVLLLLSEWCEAEQGKACTEDELAKLNSCIRYSRLSTPYLTELCTSLHSPLLTVEQRMELLYFRSLSQDLQKDVQEMDNLKNQSSWYLPCRPARSDADVDALSMTLKIPATEMYAFLQACKDSMSGGRVPARLSSNMIYAQGFAWALLLSRSDEGYMWFGVSSSGISSLRKFGRLAEDATIPLSHLGIYCRRAIRALGSSALHDVVLTHSADGVANTFGVGNDCGAPEGGMMDKEWWQPHVLDGFITFVATVFDIAS